MLVSPHRTQRPWQGTQEKTADDRPSYDPQCYLCPGNTRANGAGNPDYQHTYVFDNDYAAILPGDGKGGVQTTGLISAQPVQGTCRVLCFSPRHDLTLADMDHAGLERVVDLWAQQTEELGAQYRWVQVFENKGSAMGASNPHPHGQIWAGDWLPVEAEKECVQQSRYLEEHGRPMLADYVRQELELGERIVVAGDHWVWMVPFWALWPFEVLLLPREPVQRIFDLTPDQRRDLALVMKQGLQAYDRLFETSFPYSMGWHGAATDGLDHPEWTLHAHYYPPLLRSATIKKFMVGYEMMAEPQRDITPEQAAERLRQLV